MNMRIRKKQVAAANLAFMKQILGQISQSFRPCNIEYGDGYFIFTIGTNAVCNFQLKETPGWLYGIWNLGKDGFELFGEYQDLVDKFKPSRTYLNYKNDLPGFLKRVKAIQLQPKLYFVDSLTNGEALVPYEIISYPAADGEEGWVFTRGYQSSASYSRNGQIDDSQDKSITQEAFVDRVYQEYQEEHQKHLNNSRLDREFSFAFFKELPNLFPEVVAVGVIDNNGPSHSVSPRFNLLVVSDQVNAKNEIELFDRLDKVVRDCSHSGQRKSCDYDFCLDTVVKGTADQAKSLLRGCDYVYTR
jgi:hypothetical protein